MSAEYPASFNASATDYAINVIVADMANEYGRASIPTNATFSPTLRAYGKELARACGMDNRSSDNLRDHELAAIYSVAKTGPDNARRMILRRAPTAASAAPMPAPSGPDMDALETAMSARMDALAGNVLDMVRDETRETLSAIPAMVAAELARITPRAVTVTLPDLPTVTLDRTHHIFPRLLRKAVARQNVYLVGGMGTGKTTVAKQLAAALSLPFYMASSVYEEHKLFGYMNANGEYVTTDFRRAYQFGGYFLFDELDRSDPGVVVSFNAATAGTHCAFPDGLVEKHKDCILMSAGNTAMRGPSREFNTAQKMDSSVLDRWEVIRMDLDEELETACCINPDWLRYCRALREAAKAQSIGELAVTPRASINGAVAIAQGDTWQEAADSIVWKELDTASRERLERLVPMSNYETSIL